MADRPDPGERPAKRDGTPGKPGKADKAGKAASKGGTRGAKPGKPSGKAGRAGPTSHPVRPDPAIPDGPTRGAPGDWVPPDRGPWRPPGGAAHGGAARGRPPADRRPPDRRGRPPGGPGAGRPPWDPARGRPGPGQGHGRPRQTPWAGPDRPDARPRADRPNPAARGGDPRPPRPFPSADRPPSGPPPGGPRTIVVPRARPRVGLRIAGRGARRVAAGLPATGGRGVPRSGTDRPAHPDRATDPPARETRGPSRPAPARPSRGRAGPNPCRLRSCWGRTRSSSRAAVPSRRSSPPAAPRIACNISQPTLSGRLRQLEQELGVPIVERGQRYHGLTPEGERVLKWAHAHPRQLAGHAAGAWPDPAAAKRL